MFAVHLFLVVLWFDLGYNFSWNLGGLHSLSTMNRQPEFSDDCSIDTQHEITIMLCNGAQDGWPVASQLITSYPSMHLNNPRNFRKRQYPHHLQDTTNFESLKIACQVSTRELQHCISASSSTTELGIMEDPFASSGSDTDYEELRSLNTMSSSGTVLDAEEEQIWCSYFKSDALHHSNKPNNPATRPPYRSQDQNISLYNRNFGSSDLPGLELLAVNHPKQNIRANKPLSILPPTTYSPFPPPIPISQQSVHSGSSASQHKSWPPRNTSHSRLPLRSRANTTPSPYKPNSPSNLSTCTTIFANSESQSTPTSTTTSNSSPLYMPYHSSSSHPRPRIDMMDLMAQNNSFVGTETEISTFEYDDDEDLKSKGQRLATKLHFKNTGGNSASDGISPTPRPKRSRRSLSQVWKGMLRLKKGGTL